MHWFVALIVRFLQLVRCSLLPFVRVFGRFLAFGYGMPCPIFWNFGVGGGYSPIFLKKFFLTFIGVWWWIVLGKKFGESGWQVGVGCGIVGVLGFGRRVLADWRFVFFCDVLRANGAFKKKQMCPMLGWRLISGFMRDWFKW